MTLQELGIKYQADKATLHGFCDFYEKILQDIKVSSLLEIGVHYGASMKMWREYFPEVKIVGVDINKPQIIDGCTIFKDDATTKEFASMLGNFDVIIDDGSHFMSEQKKSFNNLRKKVNKGGVYIIEDVHTSFWEKYIDELPTTYEYIMELVSLNNIRYKEFRLDKDKHISGTLVLYK